jgi:monoamine oxidase
MVLTGSTPLESEDWLSKKERERRAAVKEEQMNERGLTPDWFKRQGDYCLPPGGLKVAVIGGGFSGLAAAWYLKSCGATPTVFEARDQIGGRVRTDRRSIKGKVLEEGAELIGENHALWRLLAKRFGLTLEAMSEEADFPGLNSQVWYGGRQLSEAEKKKLDGQLEPIWTAIGEQARPLPETEPWNHRLAAGYDGESILHRLEGLTHGAHPNVLSWFEFTLGNDNCAPIGKQSYLGLLGSVSAARMGSDAPGMFGYWKSTETERCSGGNDLLGQKMAAFLGRAVRTGVKIDAIAINSGSYYPPVLVTSIARDPTGGERAVPITLPFHYAVLTAPAPAWKGIQISPPFNPAWLTLQHGAAVKFISRHKTEFWKEEGLSPLAKSTELGSVWEGPDKQPKEIPGYALTVFAGGQYVLPSAQYPAGLTALYPGRRKDLVGEKFVDWPAEKFIEAGYAVPAVGEASTILPALNQPYHRRLYFAGEQASPGFFGYMEGALQTGARAAREIILDAIVECPGRRHRGTIQKVPVT